MKDKARVMAGRGRRGFGEIERLPSGRYRVRYTGPDALRHGAPHTFGAKIDAEGWLAEERRLVELGTWTPPEDRGTRLPLDAFGAYAEAWLANRPLKPRTREHYASLLRGPLASLAPARVADLTPVMVRTWHAQLNAKHPTLRAHAYSLLRAILKTAVEDELLPQNPCHIRGAGNSKRVHKIEPLTIAQLETLVAAMPKRYQVMTLLAAWCGLRFGELTELRRSDIDLDNKIVIRIRRGVVRVGGRYLVGTPKSAAGIRDVAIPPHIVLAIRQHMKDHAAFGRDGLLFPAANDPTGHLAPTALYTVFYPARQRARVPQSALP